MPDNQDLLPEWHAPSNHGFRGEKDLVEDGINLSIPSDTTVPTFSASTETSSETKQDSTHE